MKEFELPDGTVAETTQDVEKYLKRSGSAMSSDFSSGYIKNVRYQNEKVQREEAFKDFVHNYKRMIWNE